LEGTELIAVNGTPVREFLRPVLGRCSGETPAFRGSRFVADQPFWFYFTKLFDGMDRCTLRLRDQAGAERDAASETLGLSDYKQFLASLPAVRRRGTEVQFFDDGIALFTYPSFQLSDAEKKKIADIFQQVRDKKSRDLVLDLRGNGGGNSEMGDYIFSYLYEGEFTAFSKVRISKMSDGIVETYSGSAQKHNKPSAFFSGRVWLLVDNGTFSSAADFAAMFRDYSVGKIIGYETGGLPVCFGDVYSFTLDHSGIPCGVSYKQFFCPKPRPGDDEHGVLPDLPVSSSLLAPFPRERDPLLAYTLKHIREVRE
jgi:C-terminal processing protease CtpA/Prc